MIDNHCQQLNQNKIFFELSLYDTVFSIIIFDIEIYDEINSNQKNKNIKIYLLKQFKRAMINLFLRSSSSILFKAVVFLFKDMRIRVFQLATLQSLLLLKKLLVMQQNSRQQIGNIFGQSQEQENTPNILEQKQYPSNIKYHYKPKPNKLDQLLLRIEKETEKMDTDWADLLKQQDYEMRKYQQKRQIQFAQTLAKEQKQKKQSTIIRAIKSLFTKASSKFSKIEKKKQN